MERRHYFAEWKAHFNCTSRQSHRKEKTMNKPATALYLCHILTVPFLIAQLQGEPQILTSLQELNGRKGFVIAPFRLTSSTPAVLIRPDLIAKGWDQIHEVLQLSSRVETRHHSCGQ